MLRFRTNCFRVTRKIFLVAHFQQRLLGLLHFFFGTADYNLKEVMVYYKSILQYFLQANSNLIRSTIGGRKFDLDTPTVLHDGLNQFTASTNKRLVIFGRNL
jgi:hypothetical protein